MGTPFDNPEVSALDLAGALESPLPVQVLDVRAPFRVATGKIDLVPDERFINIPGSKLVGRTDFVGTGIDPELPLAVVCGYGKDSAAVAEHLRRLGYRASSLRGGMSAWMTLTLARELETTACLDRMIQFDRIGKGALGYLLISDAEALIVDPPRDYEAYLRAAANFGAKVVGVADTHVHADYISGAPAIARNLGAPYYLHPADAVYPYDGTPGRLEFHALEDGDIIEFGRCSMRADHTPGHTEGSLSYIIDDSAALTGDFIFVASIGRPDLAGKVAAWTGQLWDSLERVKREWPEVIKIYPAHYAGEGERGADRTVGAPLGRLLQENESLRFTEGEAFRRWVETMSTSFPEGYRKIKAINVGLVTVDEAEADELEVGKNECALGGL